MATIKIQPWTEPLWVAAERVRREARGIWRRASNGAEDAWGEGAQWVRRHPLPGVLAGCGVGMLVGAALGSVWRGKAVQSPGASGPSSPSAAALDEFSAGRLLKAVGSLLRERFEKGCCSRSGV